MACLSELPRNVKSRLWKQSNSEKVRKSKLQYRLNNPNKQREWASNNIEHLRLYQQEYRRKNPHKVKENNKRQRSTLYGRLNDNISRHIRYSLQGRKGGTHWEWLLDFTAERLKEHLEGQFANGMSWENYGKFGWVIDHKIPLAAFNFETAEDMDFKRCWALSNLQPMWMIENAKKKDSLNEPFQPSLLLRGGQ